MLQPIDQPSPVKAASGEQKLPTCGQNRPASSAHHERATTLNCQDLALNVLGEGKEGAWRRPEK